MSISSFKWMTSDDASFPPLLASFNSQRIPRTLPLLSSSIHWRIWPGACLVGTPCITMLLALVLTCWGFGMPGVDGGGVGGVRCLFAGTGIAFGPVVGCFPLSFLVGGGPGLSDDVVEVAASA